MMALVSPQRIAMDKKPAPIVSRSGMPNETFEAPRTMFNPSCWCMSEIVSSVRTTSVVSAPIGIAKGSRTMSSLAMP